MDNKLNRFPLAMRIMHWSMAALIISMLIAGLLMVESLEPWQLTLLNLHKAFGLLAFILLIIRFVIRLNHKLPELPKDLSKWQSQAAIVSHWALYVLMVLMPLTGYLMQYFAGRPVSVFGWFNLPASLQVNIEAFALFRELHGYTALALICVILLHVAAALHHHFIRKDSVLRSMM